MVFIRIDIPVAQQAIQAAHSVYEASRNIDPSEDHPSFVFIEIKNSEELSAAQEFASSQGLKTFPFYEPYANWGTTAFACEPITQDKRHLFSNFKLWRK